MARKKQVKSPVGGGGGRLPSLNTKTSCYYTYIFFVEAPKVLQIPEFQKNLPGWCVKSDVHDQGVPHRELV